MLLLFFDIDKIEWGGITASRRKARLKRAVRQVAKLEVSTEPVEPSPPPAIWEAVSVGYEGLVHREPFDLNPPTDSAERFLWAIEKIRIELIILAGNSGNLPRRVGWDQYRIEDLARYLDTRGVVPPAMVEIASVLWDTRNDLLHGGLKGEPLGMVDTLALDLLQKLREVKRQYIRVRDPEVTLFRDQSLSALFQETGGVMLVTLDERGRVLNTSVYPRLMQYAKGRFVSWEWKMERGFDDEAWYRDPTTDQPKLAWSESATFFGREYPEQWGLEYDLPRPDAGIE